MPKIYEYNGYSFLFYSNDHEPPHCHVQKAGKMLRIRFVNTVGAISLKYSHITEKRKFTKSEIRNIDDFARPYSNEILEKWDIFFNQKKKPKFEKIAILKKQGSK